MYIYCGFTSKKTKQLKDGVLILNKMITHLF